MWTLQAQLFIDGVKLHCYDLPGIFVHGGALPPDTAAQQAAEAKAKGDYESRVVEAKNRLANRTLIWW